MKKIILCMLFVIISNLKAEDAVWLGKNVHFSYSSVRDAYSCSYLKQQANHALQLLNARDVQVICRGGLPYDSLIVANISFRSAVATRNISGGVDSGLIENADYSALNLKSKNSCSFNLSLIKDLLSAFDVNALVDKSHCWDSKGRVDLRFNVLK